MQTPFGCFLAQAGKYGGGTLSRRLLLMRVIKVEKDLLSPFAA